MHQQESTLMSEPITFDYRSFVHELSVLHNAFSDPPANHRSFDSPEFRRWRHEFGTLIDQIEVVGYEISCNLSRRQFRVLSMYGSVSQREQRDAFDRDLADTLVEIETIIKRYDKYGDPKAKPAAVLGNGIETKNAQPLLPPDKVTWNWVREHVPLGWAIGVMLTLVSVSFGAGLGLGQSSLYKYITISAEQTGTTATKSVVHTPESAASQGVSRTRSDTASNPSISKSMVKVP